MKKIQLLLYKIMMNKIAVIIIQILISFIVYSIIHEPPKIKAEGFPCIGENVVKIIYPMEQARAGLVQGVNGEWYDPNDMVEQENNPYSSESSSDNKSESSNKSETRSESDCSDSKSDTSTKTTSSVSNKTSEEEVTFEDSFEEDSQFQFNNEILYNLYHDIGNLQDTADIFKVCKEYAILNVPPDCWAKSNAEISDESAAIYTYLQQLKNNIAGSTEEIIYNYYCAGVNTYNIAIINEIEDEDHMIMLFDATVERFT